MPCCEGGWGDRRLVVLELSVCASCGGGCSGELSLVTRTYRESIGGSETRGVDMATQHLRHQRCAHTVQYSAVHAFSHTPGSYYQCSNPRAKPMRSFLPSPRAGWARVQVHRPSLFPPLTLTKVGRSREIPGGWWCVVRCGCWTSCPDPSYALFPSRVILSILPYYVGGAGC